MRHHRRREPLEYENIIKSETESVILLIEDPDFSPHETLVPFVYNIADKDQPINEELEWLNPDNPSPKKKYGKPAGGGLPTGGVEDQYLERSGETVVRETQAETGLTVERVSHLFTDYGIIISDARTGAKIRRISYSKGKQKSVQILPKVQKALDNPIHVFSGRVKNWDQSSFRKFLLTERAYLIETGQATVKEIADTGICVRGLTKEDYDFLGITEANEVDGIALISVSALVHMRLSGDFRFAKDFFVYPSHINRTLTGLFQMGVLKTQEIGANQ